MLLVPLVITSCVTVTFYINCCIDGFSVFNCVLIEKRIPTDNIVHISTYIIYQLWAVLAAVLLLNSSLLIWVGGDALNKYPSCCVHFIKTHHKNCNNTYIITICCVRSFYQLQFITKNITSFELVLVIYGLYASLIWAYTSWIWVLKSIISGLFWL